jgi:hypothetical protein
MPSLADPDPHLQPRVMWRVTWDTALYELWWLPHQGRHGLALHRNRELFDAVSLHEVARGSRLAMLTTPTTAAALSAPALHRVVGRVERNRVGAG